MKLGDRLVKELMTCDPKTIDVTCPIGDAINALFTSEIRHLPVLRHGELVGMLSDRDLKEHCLPVTEVLERPEDADRRRAQPVGIIATGQFVTVREGHTVGQAIALMLGEQVSALPVLADGSSKLVGIISYVDLLRAIAAEK